MRPRTTGFLSVTRGGIPNSSSIFSGSGGKPADLRTIQSNETILVPCEDMSSKTQRLLNPIARTPVRETSLQ